MNAKLVVPSKVTEAPVFSLVRINALLAGACIPDRVMSMHAATAGEIWDHAVQRHGVGVVVVVGIVVVVTDELEVLVTRIGQSTWEFLHRNKDLPKLEVEVEVGEVTDDVAGKTNQKSRYR